MKSTAKDLKLIINNTFNDGYPQYLTLMDIPYVNDHMFGTP